MYGWLFRHLPGPLWVRIVLAIVIIAAVVAVLMLWVFPWAQASFFEPAVTVGDS